MLALSFAPAAAFAAPNPDTVVPTQTYGPSCTVSFTGATVCKTDNKYVWYWMETSGEFALEAVDRDIVHNSIGRYQPTDLEINYESSPVFVGDNETDVIFQEGSRGLATNVVGYTWCNGKDPTNTIECDQTYIRMRGEGQIGYRVATHESGHAFGLLHGWESYPIMGQCDAIMGVMRGSLGCAGFTTAALGSHIITNVNYSY